MVNETLKHGPKFIALTLEWRRFFGWQCINLGRDFQLGGNFCQRAFGDKEKLNGFFVCLPSVTFCDIAAYTHGGTSQLVAQTKIG